MEITIEILVSAGCKTSIAPFLLPYFKEVCIKYEINTPERICAFLAQTSHESGSFFYTQEIASGSAYEGRKDLGNVFPGDGIKFKGHGFIQESGRENYIALSREFGVDFVTNPDLLGAKNINLCSKEQMYWATMSAGSFWNKRKLNKLADLMDIKSVSTSNVNDHPFESITHKINGGYNGLLSRREKYDKIRLCILP